MSAVVIDAENAKPCPFCGSADLHVETDSEPGSSYQVMCDNPACEAQGPNGAITASEAVDRWNNRTV